jgi:hypothetical protein
MRGEPGNCAEQDSHADGDRDRQDRFQRERIGHGIPASSNESKRRAVAPYPPPTVRQYTSFGLSVWSVSDSQNVGASEGRDGRGVKHRYSAPGGVRRPNFSEGNHGAR